MQIQGGGGRCWGRIGQRVCPRCEGGGCRRRRRGGEFGTGPSSLVITGDVCRASGHVFSVVEVVGTCEWWRVESNGLLLGEDFISWDLLHRLEKILERLQFLLQPL